MRHKEPIHYAFVLLRTPATVERSFRVGRRALRCTSDGLRAKVPIGNRFWLQLPSRDLPFRKMIKRRLSRSGAGGEEHVNHLWAYD